MTNDNVDSTDVLSAALAKIEMIVGNTTFPDSPTIRRKRGLQANTLDRLTAAKKAAKHISRRVKEPRPSQNDKSTDEEDTPRKKSSSGNRKIFYRVVKGRKVSYEFNATYRTPSDSEWISEIQIRPKSENESTRKKSKSEQSDSETEPEEAEEFDIFDIATAKLMSKQLQKVKPKNISTSNSSGPGIGARRMQKPKMDLAKALATMGFGTARIVDAHGDRDAQDELNDALTRLMEVHEKKKKKMLDTEKIEERRKQQSDKLRDEVRTVHEAYQFLAKKYKYDKQRLKERQLLESAEANKGSDDEEEKDDEVFDFKTILAIKKAGKLMKKGKGEETEAAKENLASIEVQEEKEEEIPVKMII